MLPCRNQSLSLSHFRHTTFQFRFNVKFWYAQNVTWKTSEYKVYVNINLCVAILCPLQQYKADYSTNNMPGTPKQLLLLPPPPAAALREVPSMWCRAVGIIP